MNCGACNNICATVESCVASTCQTDVNRWQTLGGDLRHSGFNPNESGTPPLTRAWRADFGVGALEPVVSDGTAVFVSQSGYGFTNQLWAVSAVDGSVLWSHDFGSLPLIGQPTFDAGRLYVAQSDFSGDTFLYALDAPTGAFLWMQPFDSGFETIWAPLVIRSTLYFASTIGLYSADSMTGMVKFVQGLDGFEQWTPLYLQATVFTFSAGHLRAHDQETGAVLGTAEVAWDPMSFPRMATAPVSDGQKIYMVAQPTNRLFAFRPGEPLPDWTAVGPYTSMPAVADGIVFAVAGGVLRAHDSGTGMLLWTFSGDSMLNHPPAIAGHWVYVASDAQVYAVDISTASLAWSDASGGWLSIAAGKLYVAGNDGFLTAYVFSR